MESTKNKVEENETESLPGAGRRHCRRTNWTKSPVGEPANPCEGGQFRGK